MFILAGQRGDFSEQVMQRRWLKSLSRKGKRKEIARKKKKHNKKVIKKGGGGSVAEIKKGNK
jgi:hypothetical protein